MIAGSGRSLLKRGLAGILAIGIGLMPATHALAEQVLEVPQIATPASAASTASAGSEAPAAIPHHRHRQTAQRNIDAPTPSNIGSIDDYEHQEEADSFPGSSRYASSSNFAGSGFGGNYGGTTLQFESGNSREAVTNNLILGAMVLGLFAMEVDAA